MTKSRIAKLLTIVILFGITLFIINPKECMDATINGLKIWVLNVVPALFPFFILTRIIIAINQTSISSLDKFTYKFFKVPNSGLVYFLSLLSGYPVGAKLISNYYQNGTIDKQSAIKMFSFCSTSGPMFIIGTVGIAIFKNVKIGYVLLLGHFIGSVLNGLLYRGKGYTKIKFNDVSTNISLNEIMFDSINSILMVGGYIVFSSVLIQLLQISSVLPNLVNVICKITPFNYDMVYGLLCGCIEMTNGLIIIGGTNIALKVKVIIASILISFSGLCIMLQSKTFMDKIGIKMTTVFIQKITQTIFTALATILLCILLF